MKDILKGWILDLGIPEPISSKSPKPLNLFPPVLSSADLVVELYDAFAFYRSLCSKHFFYRGHSDSEFQLISSIGRINSVDYSKEKDIFCDLRSICIKKDYSRYKKDSFNEELFYYGIGRHLGLTCRLLDWTSGFWDAISFLLYDNYDKNGDLWVMMIPRDYDLENRSPFFINDSRIHILKEDYFIPDSSVIFPLGILRRSRQHGFFTVVKEPWLSTPLNEISEPGPIEFYRFIIPREVKDSLRSHPRVVSVDEWFYVTQADPLICEINKLNEVYSSLAL